MSAARDLAYLCRELKAPSLLAGVERLAERARADAWSHEDFLAACLEREVSSRAVETHAQALGLAEPALRLRLGNALDEVVADLDQP